MFKFKLEPVLSLKEKMEDSKKRELGVAAMQADKLKNEKLQLLEKKNILIKEAKQQNLGNINVQYLRAFNQYHARMEQDIKNKDHELIAAQQMVEKKRKLLLEAVKERKILDNLKAIEEEAFKEEEKRTEQSIVDDIVTYKYGVKGRSKENE